MYTHQAHGVLCDATDASGEYLKGDETMNLKKREADGVLLIYVEGKMVGGDDSDKFHDFIKDIVSEGHKKIVINLKKVPWADSRGIGMLIGAHTSIENAGGNMVLTNIGDRIDSVLTLTRLLLIFKTFDSEDEGIQYLTSGEPT
jgi:anti-sigma B factor antagonist